MICPAAGCSNVSLTNRNELVSITVAVVKMIGMSQAELDNHYKPRVCVVTLRLLLKEVQTCCRSDRNGALFFSLSEDLFFNLMLLSNCMNFFQITKPTLFFAFVLCYCQFVMFALSCKLIFLLRKTVT